MRLDWLADVLRAAGLDVIEYDGWQERTNRPFDSYTPIALLDHHTAGSSILTNYPDPPDWPDSRLAKVCNLTIRGSGIVVVLNAGYAYDSGNGDRKVLDAVRNDQPAPAPTDTYDNLGHPAGPNPGITGNPWFIDIEVQHLGNGDPIHPPQREALITANRAICDRMGWNPETRLLGHREWTKRKVDPRWDGFSNPMPQIRIDSQPEDDTMFVLRTDPDGQSKAWKVEYWKRQLLRIDPTLNLDPADGAAPWGEYTDTFADAVKVHATPATGEGIGPGEADRILVKLHQSTDLSSYMTTEAADAKYVAKGQPVVIKGAG